MTQCKCGLCETVPHDSDCAVHNEPEARNGDCDCKGNATIAEVKITVPLPVVDDIRDALADARENAQELLTDHDDRLGRTISKNRFVAEMYESQLGKIASLIMKLSNL